MKRKMMIFTLVLTLMAGVYFVGASDLFAVKVSADMVDKNQKMVSVTGKGTVLVKPDIAYLNLGVETTDADSKVAQEQNKKIMNTVFAALEKAGLKKSDIATEGYSIYRTHDDSKPYSSTEKRQRIYQVNNQIKVTVKNIDQVGALIDVATTAGANQMNGIEFSVVDREKYYNQALTLAMANAKTKADTILKTFGKSATTPISVTESGSVSPVYERMKYAGAVNGNESSTEVQAGDLTIKATLFVNYGY